MASLDLPGYGYARVSKSQKKVFQSFITSYFEKRKQVINAFLLIDIRHEPQPIDVKFMEWLGENQIPFAIDFTKADKLKPKAQDRNIAHYKQEMLASAWEELKIDLKDNDPEVWLNYEPTLARHLSKSTIAYYDNVINGVLMKAQIEEVLKVLQ